MYISCWLLIKLVKNLSFIGNFGCDSGETADTYSLKQHNRDFLRDWIQNYCNTHKFAELSVHEAVKGHIIPCSYCIFPFCRCGNT